MSMITVDTARGILGIRERIRPVSAPIRSDDIQRWKEETDARAAARRGATARPVATPPAAEDQN